MVAIPRRSGGFSRLIHPRERLAVADKAERIDGRWARTDFPTGGPTRHVLLRRPIAVQHPGPC